MAESIIASGTSSEPFTAEEIKAADRIGAPPSTLSESAGARYIDRDKLWALFVNHYWDSFAEQRDLVLCHVEAVMRMLPDAAPVQAEPVAWQWRSEPNGFWNQMYGTIPDFKRMHKRELKSGEIEIRALYASPPTPVLGERDETRIQELARRMFNRFHNPALWDHPRSIMARDNFYDFAREVLYAIPVPAGLGKQRRQIDESTGNEKVSPK